ncbi:threonine/serine exporter family protein [Clostridium taeniosporum]|uniref:Threonine/serine exporter n=1 Tax=Clostridium taeniosporum TaxID=394958 RepID=A0A1D7XID9_9CLOT|nr:threonine/serine exporter family protein [Clostridium taeniosporum]AOR23107.1 threonine/serine exporter [Clostridium taeniosporum]
MIKEIIISFIASFGFGIMFNIKGKKLFFAAVGGGISWFVYSLLLKLNLSNVLSLFVSSVVFSIYSEICARILKTPVTTIVVCALIPLVPGAGMYYTMYEIITGNILRSLEVGMNTLASAGMLALGVIFVSTITRQITNFRRIKKLRLENKKIIKNS